MLHLVSQWCEDVSFEECLFTGGRKQQAPSSIGSSMLINGHRATVDCWMGEGCLVSVLTTCGLLLAAEIGLCCDTQFLCVSQPMEMCSHQHFHHLARQGPTASHVALPLEACTQVIVELGPAFRGLPAAVREAALDMCVLVCGCA